MDIWRYPRPARMPIRRWPLLFQKPRGKIRDGKTLYLRWMPFDTPPLSLYRGPRLRLQEYASKWPLNHSAGKNSMEASHATPASPTPVQRKRPGNPYRRTDCGPKKAEQTGGRETAMGTRAHAHVLPPLITSNPKRCARRNLNKCRATVWQQTSLLLLCRSDNRQRSKADELEVGFLRGMASIVCLHRISVLEK